MNADGSISLRDNGHEIELSKEQWEIIEQQRRLRNLDRDSHV